MEAKIIKRNIFNDIVFIIIYAVHFVEQRAEDNPYYKRKIIVFNNADEFFQYFNIYGIGKLILLKIIPPNYLMEIDNFKFEKSIRELIRNY